MSSSIEITTLEAIEQKVICFLEDELVAARAEDGHIYVSLRHLCQALGLDRYGQVQRVQRQIVLNRGHYYILNFLTSYLLLLTSYFSPHTPHSPPAIGEAKPAGHSGVVRK
jgi:hypothetical protein